MPDFSLHDTSKREKYAKLPKNYQMAIKYTNIFRSKALNKNLPKLGFFGLKIRHLATRLPHPSDCRAEKFVQQLFFFVAFVERRRGICQNTHARIS
jgi:hypothetical protein